MSIIVCSRCVGAFSKIVRSIEKNVIAMVKKL